MRVFIAGVKGQLGYELIRTAPLDAQITALDLPELDVADGEQVAEAVRAARPELVINAAAFTAVDKAEGEKETAYAVNEAGARNLARAARRLGARLVHTSTDFVFDGRQGRPYRPDDRPNPLGVYGASKLAGELAVAQELEEGAWATIRTAWLYSAHGANFVKTMLKLMNERRELAVVCDQLGSPTWAHDLAGAIWRAAEVRLAGLHHFTDSGAATWYDFAVAIAEEGLGLGLISRPIPIHPIPAAQYPTPAARPAMGLIDKTGTFAALGLEAPHWRVSLRQMLKELAHNG